MRITSTAFENGKTIPKKYTADGANVSPPLGWSGAPHGTKSFALVMDDPDAPVGTWDHWLLWGIAGSATSLPEGVSAERSGAKPAGMIEGRNTWGNVGYEGPEPPPGKPHRYIFRLLALKAPLATPVGADKKRLLADVEAVKLAEASLTGLYGR